jgi:hypothetical protein
MQEDARCCGTGTCILDAQGRCWCGQQWDGVTLCKPGMGSAGALPVPVPPRAEPQTGLA